ncbi:TRAP transporter substrate-binding protein DctP [Aestuariivita sp.]|jgi:TRAP-type C4-dicarboxylate transport system substrate-binding protein|uniref:TRAP transporter substrate-binding protein DctP n=1 Tax=Aestuariivita sp. TaxID=1872407 RepID=UPI0021701140|nr:TRAP transporter substrate-binding protein DctP [Aestuariivita sp.]MCE8008215.1 TRAP transporter substrate-binding protein DctP [Aestuariivita sp.]
MTFFTRLTASLPALGLALAMAPAATAEDRVSAVHAFPEFLVYTKTFLAMVEDINARGEGVVQIDVRGGPEAIGMFQQPAAVRDGVIDMVHTPGSFYGANVPEIDAMVAARVTPMEARANGGAAIMDQAHQERFNVRHLGWIDGGIKFHIYMNSEPTFREDGILDLTGVKLRDNPIYNAFFTALNATTASMPATEVYSALEKGVVDSAAWTQIGIPQLRWNEFLTHRVDPTFYNTDIGVIFNLDAWNALSPEAQELIETVVIEWEEKSYNDRQADVATDDQILAEGGMIFVDHPTEAAGEAYRKIADDASWGRMKERIGGDDAGMERYKMLRKHYALDDGAS